MAETAKPAKARPKSNTSRAAQQPIVVMQQPAAVAPAAGKKKGGANPWKAKAEAVAEKSKRAAAKAREQGKLAAARVTGAVATVTGGLVGGALKGYYPEKKLGPIDVRTGVALVAGATALWTMDGKGGMGDHLMCFAEGVAASVASDYGKSMAESWAGKNAAAPAAEKSAAATAAEKAAAAAVAEKAANAPPADGAKAEGVNDAAAKLRKVLLSQPTDRSAGRKAGGGIPSRRKA